MQFRSGQTIWETMRPGIGCIFMSNDITVRSRKYINNCDTNISTICTSLVTASLVLSPYAME